MNPGDFSSCRERAPFEPYAGYCERMGDTDIIYGFSEIETERCSHAWLVRVTISRTPTSHPRLRSHDIEKIRCVSLAITVNPHSAG